MKIAILSDIHGNSYALKEVLKDAERYKIDHILVLGDIVGYYYHPDKVLDMLSKWNHEIIKGNHEKLLENILKTPALAESIKLKYGSGHQEALNKLTLEQLNYLHELNEVKSVSYDGVSFLMSHGSPWSNDEYIYPDCDKEVSHRCDSREHDFVLIGHTHYAFSINNQNSTLINPGSVGQSRQKGGKASWCIVNTKNKSVQFLLTDYDITYLAKEIIEKGDNKYLLEVLKRK